jgi:DNA (cytosine-5)-methyltransferase 1
MPRGDKETFVDLFAGCGGLSLGLMAAGLSGLFGTEKDRFAFRTLRTNLVDGDGTLRYEWPEWLPKRAGTVHWLATSFKQELMQLRGRVSLVTGGPPCQGFSFAGRRRANDPRNSLFECYADVVDLLRPKFVLLENVSGIDVAFGGPDWQQHDSSTRMPQQEDGAYSATICATLRDLGYEPFEQIVRSAEFGVPQLRPRYIVVGVKRSLIRGESFPDPFRVLERGRRAFLRKRGLPEDKPVTVEQAISDLESRERRLV